jgi:hypothetical protein
MLKMAWAELSELSARIDHLQAQRNAARAMGRDARATTLAAELDSASRERDCVVARITAQVTAGALHRPEAAHRLVA